MARDSVSLTLTRQDVRELRNLAHIYDTLRPVRLVVRLTSRGPTRQRFRFVAQESAVLQRFADATLASMTNAEEEQRAVDFTPRALVAFWGRILAGLRNERRRRKLSPESLERRERLETRFAEAARDMAKRDPGLVERELQTRRSSEAAWMRERLEN